MDCLINGTSGDFQKLLVAMMKPLKEYYSDEIYNAMDKIFADADVLIQIMCTLSNQEIRVMKKVFENSKSFNSFIQIQKNILD